MAHLVAHHALEFAHGAFHEAGELLKVATDRDLDLDGLKLALEFLDFAQAVGDDLGVLFVERFEAFELGVVVGDILLDGAKFFGEVRAVGLVVGGGRGLKEISGLGALAFLALDLVFEEGDLASELTVGVMGLVGLGFGVADTALDDGLVDGVVLGGFFGHEAEVDEEAFEGAEHGDGGLHG